MRTARSPGFAVVLGTAELENDLTLGMTGREAIALAEENTGDPEQTLAVIRRRAAQAGYATEPERM